MRRGEKSMQQSIDIYRLSISLKCPDNTCGMVIGALLDKVEHRKLVIFENKQYLPVNTRKEKDLP
jgi:hypothetical protein